MLLFFCIILLHLSELQLSKNLIFLKILSFFLPLYQNGPSSFFKKCQSEIKVFAFRNKTFLPLDNNSGPRFDDKHIVKFDFSAI